MTDLTTRTTTSIPEPPREPCWRPCLARRWVAGLVGFILVDLALTLWAAQAITKVAPLPTDIVVGALLGPGLVLMGFWLRGVLRLRVMLREGALTQGETLQIKKVPGLNPPHLKLRYRLRDDAGHHHETTQFVRAGSALGQRLLEQPESLPVIHDHHEPGFSRAVVAEDFVTA